MARRPGAPKFRRAPAAERRAALIAATLACLARFGHEGLSVRRISAEAGVSMGLINHHFRGVAALVAAAYESLATALLQSVRRAAQKRPAGALERLDRLFAASFAPEALDPALFRVWVVFWSMVAHSPEMRAVHDRTYASNRSTLESLLRRLRDAPGVPPFRVRTAAIGLTALMDGLWVELSLDSRAFRPADAVLLCKDWIRALATGGFPALRMPRRDGAAR
jgi:TetR/AcrR family transcriptional regulator, transcriptional repressor of bet genes